MTPETDGTAEAALRKARATLESSLGQVDAHFGNLVSRIDTVLETATFVSPGAALLFSRRVSSSLAELGARIREAVTEIRRILDSSTPIFSLIHVGTSWNMQVLPRLSALVGVARDIRANALHAWGGEASRAYQEKRWGQRDGLQGLTNVVKDTSQWLVDVAVLNTTFLTDITKFVDQLAKDIIEAALEIATVFGIIEAIDTVAGATARALDSIVETAREVARHTEESISMLNQARTILNNNDVFPGGRWPQAVNR